mgnify:CR=1 FL=1
MEHIHGPDFPTRGIIMGRSGIRAAYATGRGRITVRARHEFEEFGKDRTRIIITEIPYQVNSGCSSRIWPTRWRTSAWRASPTSGTRPTGTVCALSSS